MDQHYGWVVNADAVDSSNWYVEVSPGPFHAHREKNKLPMRLSVTHLIILFTFFSWSGEYIHNFFDLPQLTLLSPENSMPALVSAVLVLCWCLLPSKLLPTLALLIWALMHLIVGGLLSVLPLPFWPFFPAQTLFHYLMHGIYVLAQLPLIIILVEQLRQVTKKREKAAAQV